MKRVLGFAVVASALFAQDPDAAAREAAGCGPTHVQFVARRDKNRHPVGQREASKALLYFFGDEDLNERAFHIGNKTTRWGVDGKWVGATELRSYFFVSVDPGEHRICTSVQSPFRWQQKRISAAISLAADAGRVYYFRLMTPHIDRPEEVALAPVDPAAAQLLLATMPSTVSHVK